MVRPPRPVRPGAGPRGGWRRRRRQQVGGADSHAGTERTPYQRASVTKGRSYFARWLYQEPGKPMRAATDWTRGRAVGDFNEVSWGKDGHIGPQFHKNTKICIQYKGAATKLCRSLA